MSMKKYLFICLVALLSMSFTGCVINDSKTPDCKFHTKSIYLTVYQQEWIYDTQNRQFYAHFDLPDLSAVIYNYGNYSLHREYNTNTQEAYQVALPQNIFCSEEVENAGVKETVYYTQQVDYRVGVKYVEIQVTNSDFFYPADTHGNPIKPETMIFHLQLMY